jgi:glutamate-1-semialdehyde 2,1-aminomutase
MSTALSQKLFAEAARCIPGGVNSPVRAWNAVGGAPRFILRARGATITDADGTTYIDYVGSWGPMILGHAHPRILQAIQAALRDGTSFGAPTARELELARILTEAVPGMEKVRLVSTGTEATMTALRLARAATGRDKIIKFDGCYHGHNDALLVRAGSGALTFGTPTSPGVPEHIAAATLVAPYNDLDAVARLLGHHGREIAAVIVEPIAANMGVVLPKAGFLQGLRRLTKEAGTVLILDEVITGFRLRFGVAQTAYGVEADLTCLGKIVGGGLPLAAVGGSAAIMDQLAPLGPVYQAGTLSGNPLAVAAGIETLSQLMKPGTYERLEERGARLQAGLEKALTRSGRRGCVNRIGSILTLFLGCDEVHDATTATACDTAAFAEFFQRMLTRGVYLPPSAFEAWFVSLAHSEDDIDFTVQAADAALADR